MLIRRLEGAEDNDRDVIAENGQWRSQRLLLKDDQMGFSFHITTIYAGKDNFFHYKNHLESVYCISGEGEIEELDNGTVHQIRPGTVYALDKHDRHRLHAFSEMTMACVFNPPVSGREVHGPDGAYPADVD